MAIVKFPALSLEASGSLGDLNFYRHGSTMCARAVSSPTDPATPPQVTVRDYLADGIERWQDYLTVDQREAWTAYAKLHPRPDRLGQVRPLNGYNCFISHWMRSKRSGYTPSDDPPSSMVQAECVGYYSDWVGALHYRRFRPDDWLSTRRPDGWQLWFAGPYGYEGRKAQAPDWRFFANFTSFGIQVGPVVDDGAYYWYMMRVSYADGRQGVPVYMNLVSG